jgi:ArsR family transcriptional regulator
LPAWGPVTDPDADRLAEIFKALAHPHRILIFARLASCCSDQPPERLRVGALGEGLGIAPSTLSHHVRELRRAGLLHVERVGQTTECWVEPGTLEGLSAFFSSAVCRLLCR